MGETRWDKIWNSRVPVGVLLRQLKAEGDRLNNQLEAIKKQLATIPEDFITQAYVVLNRGTDEHHLWNFEIWYTDVKKILEDKDD